MKLSKEQINTIIQYFEIGVKKEDVSKLLGISIEEIDDIIDSNNKIKSAYELGIKLGNIKVIQALFKSATGYSVEETENYTRTDLLGDVIFKDKKVNKKQVAPNFSAIKFWLENKDNASWKQDLDEVEKNMNIKISIEGKEIIVNKQSE